MAWPDKCLRWAQWMEPSVHGIMKPRLERPTQNSRCGITAATGEPAHSELGESAAPCECAPGCHLLWMGGRAVSPCCVCGASA